MTVRLWSALGGQATPTGGANALLDVVYALRLLPVANSTPPVGRNWLAGSIELGLLAYAASAACVTWLTAAGLKPTICRLWLSVVGVAFSQRKPRLKVRFDRKCQSSCTNSAS